MQSDHDDNPITEKPNVTHRKKALPDRGGKIHF